MVTAETPVDSPVNATSLVEPPESGSYEKPAAPEAGDAVVAHPAPPSYEGSQSKAFDDVVNSDVSLVGCCCWKSGWIDIIVDWHINPFEPFEAKHCICKGLFLQPTNCHSRLTNVFRTLLPYSESGRT